MLNCRGPDHRLVRVMALVMAVVMVGGCVVSSGRDRPEAVRQVLRENRVHYDLSDPLGRPLTRSHVGFDPGSDSMTIANPGGRPYIGVAVDLPDLPQFQVEVSDVTFYAWTMDTSRDIDPHGLDLSRTYPSVDDAYQELLAFDEVYGLDTRPRRPRLEAFRIQAEELIAEYQAGESFNSYRTFVWYSPESTDEFMFGVEAAVFASTGRVGIRYMLDWPPSPAFGVDTYLTTR